MELDPYKLIAHEVEQVIIENDLDLAAEREESMSPIASAAVLKSALLTSEAVSETVSERDVALQAFVKRVQKMTGDTMLDPDALVAKARVLRKQKALRNMQRVMTRLHI